MEFESRYLKPASPERDNTSKMETENAQYEINYALHDIETNPEMVNNTDAIVLELVSAYENKEHATKQMRWIQENKRSPYKKIIQEAAKQGKPVFLVDLSKKTSDKKYSGHDFEEKTVADPAVEYAIGAGVVVAAMALSNKDKLMSRRNFILGGLATLSSAYLMTPVAKYLMGDMATKGISDVPDENSALRKTEKFLEDVVHTSHGELNDPIIDMRNDLIAQKTECIAEMLEQELGHKPKIGIVIGAAHTGIERSLKKQPDQRIKGLKEELKEDFNREAYVARIDFPSKYDGDVSKLEVTIMLDPRMSK